MIHVKKYLSLDEWSLLAYGLGITYLSLVPLRYIPECPIHYLFGIYCPGCGVTRALKALINGNIKNALHDNALFVFSPIMIGVSILMDKNVNQKSKKNAYITFVAIVVFVFTLMRNLNHSFFAPIK